MRSLHTLARTQHAAWLAAALVLALPAAAAAQMCQNLAVDPEWGDAPEGTLAYPDLGVAGLFPTCLGGPSGCIQHAFIGGMQLNNAFFGQNLDYEPDGNGGVCPPPQYENDECYGPLDGDAGLVMPTAFTFGPTGPPFTAITCSGQQPTSLGTTCGTAQWGTDIDIQITNNLFLGMAVPVPTTVYFNVLIDFNRNGVWDGVIPTPCGPIDEHVVKNVPVPPGFSGLASQLLPVVPDFLVGADSGYVWCRFSLVPDPQPVPIPWDGSGFWEGGETEDYMLHIRGGTPSAEYGDAPYDVVAYPPFPILGRFPTCVQTPVHVVHPSSAGLHLGPGIDFEGDGNANDCAFNVYDNDECFGGEAGLVVPRPWTIDHTAGGGLNIVPCAPPAGDLGVECTPIQWGTGLDIQITNGLGGDAYLNMLADWDQDGDWGGGAIGCGPNLVRSNEHVLVNLVVPAGFSGLLSQLAPPQRLIGHRGFVWTRFTLSRSQAPANWDGSGNMGEGETEDYLLRVVADPTVDTGSSVRGGLRLGEASPSPTFAGTRIDLELPAAASVSAQVYDAKGRALRDLGARTVARGVHRVVWDGRDAAGQRPAAGVYFVRVYVGDQTFTRRVLLLN